MKLLITTQILDTEDPVQFSFHAWVAEFAKHAEQVTVICLKKGKYSLPSNVRVVSLGKEEGRSRTKYLKRLGMYMWQFRHEYDTVFVHMNPEYLVLLGWWWRMTGKTIALWYTHRQVNLKLRIATLFVHIIFSASPYSFRIKTPKVRFVGHGVMVGEYTPFASLSRDDVNPTVISVGRVTAIKNIDTFVEAVALVHAKKPTVRWVIVGGPGTENDIGYEANIRALIVKRKLENVIAITGFVSPEETKEWYKKASLAINLTPPGGLDRTVIEAAASGVPTITSNIAYREYFGKYGDLLTFPLRDYTALAGKIESFFENTERDVMRKELSAMATRTFSVEGVVGKICGGIQTVSKR